MHIKFLPVGNVGHKLIPGFIDVQIKLVNYGANLSANGLFTVARNLLPHSMNSMQKSHNPDRVNYIHSVHSV